MNRTHRTLSQILSPALAAVALGVFLSACTSAAPVNDETSENNSEAMMEASSMMMNDSSDMMDMSSAGMMDTSSAMMDHDSSAMMNTSAYHDGTYSADGVYRSPAGGEDIQVTLTLKDDIVTDAQVVSMASNPKSKMMQQAFIDGYSTLVVGKPIDQLSLGVVNGSSLTPKGFMDAVTKIKVEAAS